MITAVFTDNDDYSHAYGLWQWGELVSSFRIEGLHLPTAVEIPLCATGDRVVRP